MTKLTKVENNANSGLTTVWFTSSENEDSEYAIHPLDNSSLAEELRNLISSAGSEVEVVDIPLTPLSANFVKREANRRILSIAPEWKQRNLLAASVELLNKGKANWTSDDQLLADSIQMTWDQISTIRLKSDALEAMNPIPSDYMDDKYWT